MTTEGATAAEVWSRARAQDLARLVASHRPDEELSAEELVDVLWDDPRPGAVLGMSRPDGTAVGAVAVVVDGDEPPTTGAETGSTPPTGVRGHLQLLVVEGAAARRGVGRALLAAAERWLAQRGVERVEAGGSPHRQLWPGVPHDAPALASLLASAGYQTARHHQHLEVDTTLRVEAPAGVVVHRAIHEPVCDALVAFVAQHRPEVVDQVTRSMANGCCHVALAPGVTAGGAPVGTPVPALGAEVVGFACHSVNRAGWVGPLVVHPAIRRRGVGRALLAQVCRDLWAAEYERAVIATSAGHDFFTAAADTRPGRGYVVLARPLGGLDRS